MKTIRQRVFTECEACKRPFNYVVEHRLKTKLPIRKYCRRKDCPGKNYNKKHNDKAKRTLLSRLAFGWSEDS